MNKGLIRKFATVGITVACALVMSATLPGCQSSGCKKGCASKCSKPCQTADGKTKCPKGCQKPCCKKS